MMLKIFRVMMLALAALFTILFVKSVVHAQGGPANPGSPIFDSNALLLTAKHYADDFHVSGDEALQRLRYGDEVRRIQKYLFESYPNEFAGLWVQHEPFYRIVIQLTDTTVVRNDRWLANSSLKQHLAFVVATTSLSQLRATQENLQTILSDSFIPFDIGINVTKNRVEIYSPFIRSIRKKLQNVGFLFPAYVQLIQVDRLSQTADDIYAGLALNTCTSGFSVLHDDQGEGILGISTAGHCSCQSDYCSCQSPPCNNTDPVYYSGIELPLQGVEYHNSYDVEWHTTPGYTVRNLFFDGTYNVYVYGIRNRSAQYIGEYVCKYGKVTGNGCGTIQDLFYYSSLRDGWFVHVLSGTTNLVEHGDSGGPWYRGNVAYGITYALIDTDGDGLNEGLYMPVDNYDVLDLCILRDETNPTTPVLEGVLENGTITLTWSHGDDVCGYEIHRSESPYYTPTDTTLVMRITASTGSFSSGLGVGNPNHNYYYRIKAITGSPSPSSNTIGEFDFPLTPGN